MCGSISLSVLKENFAQTTVQCCIGQGCTFTFSSTHMINCLQGPPPILPNNAAITVASLQATSSLLQQALAMASAQVAANNTAQQQVTT